MPVTLAQGSFTSGEIAPALYARVDLARYTSALRTCRNWIVLRHGGVTTRPGFRFAGPCKLAANATRLLAFELSDTETAILELGHLYLRFWRGGALVLFAGVPYEIATPWTASMVGTVQAAQVGAIMTLVHPDVAPRQLEWLGESLLWFLSVPTFTSPDATPGVPTLAAFDASTPTKAHEYVVTRVNALTGIETKPSPVATITANLLPDKPITVTMPIGGGTFNVYRGRGGVWGYIGTTTATTFLDEALVPSYGDPPPLWPNPFSAAGQYPATVTHFEQRRLFAGMTDDRQTVRASRTSELVNFGAASPARDDDAIEVTLAATQAQGIRHLVPLTRLLALTTRGEWAAEGGANAALTPAMTGFRQQSAYGASPVPPVLTGDGAVYVQDRGQRVRDLVYNEQLLRYGGTELSVLATHLFQHHTIVDLAFADAPFSVVWCVRDDGALLALTYVREQEVWGWSQHVTDGAVERIAVAREGDEDVLYAVIRRTVQGATVRYVERLATRYPADPLTAVCLDAALSYDGRNTDPARTLTLTGGTQWVGGEGITATISGAPPAGAGVGDVFAIRDASGVLLLNVVLSAVLTPSTFTVLPDRTVPTALRGVPVATWALAQQRFVGLTHLAGRTVSALVDGNVERDLVVSSLGVVTLGFPGAVVTVGLSYTSQLETLDITMPNAGTVRDKPKNVSGATIYVEASRGLYAGETEASMVEIKQRESERYDDPVALHTETFQVRFPSSWRYPGRVLVEQRDPLPATVLAILPEVSIGG